MIKDLIVIIPARGNSKGIKYKNLKIFNKKKLIDYSILFANKLKPEDIIVSSEDKKILSHCKKFKLTVHKRNKKLSEDRIHTSKVVIEVIKNLKIKKNKYICLLQPTYPLRELKKFRNAIIEFMKSKSYSLIGITETGYNINNIRSIKNNFLIGNNISLEQRQSAKKAYAVNGSIFLTKVSNLLKFQTFHSKSLSKFIICKKKLSIDINTQEDVKNLRIFFKKNIRYDF